MDASFDSEGFTFLLSLKPPSRLKPLVMQEELSRSNSLSDVSSPGLSVPLLPLVVAVDSCKDVMDDMEDSDVERTWLRELRLFAFCLPENSSSSSCLENITDFL